MLLNTDLKTHIYGELVDAISREDDDIMNAAIAAAEQQAKGYLHRYDLEVLFGAVGNDRDPLLMMYLKDLASWHFITLANANIDLELRKTRFDEAIKALENIQRGKISPENWALPAVAEGTQDPGDIFLLKSQPKRNTRY